VVDVIHADSGCRGVVVVVVAHHDGDLVKVRHSACVFVFFLLLLNKIKWHALGMG
jgi:hypothetical protein